MNAIEFVTTFPTQGQLAIPEEILRQIHVKTHSPVRVLILYEEQTDRKGLSRFCGAWQDDRDAEELVAEIYADRQQNTRTESVAL